LARKPKIKAQPKADGYRLRMVCNKWYLHLEHKSKLIGEMGPYTYHEAIAEAEQLGLPDRDRS
jgi:hypothetical protein